MTQLGGGGVRSNFLKLDIIVISSVWVTPPVVLMDLHKPHPVAVVWIFSPQPWRGFRFVTRGGTRPTLHSNHTPRPNQVPETAFPNNDDDLIADAVSVCAVDSDQTPPGSYRRYLAQRMERDTPSPQGYAR